MHFGGRNNGPIRVHDGRSYFVLGATIGAAISVLIVLW